MSDYFKIFAVMALVISPLVVPVAVSVHGAVRNRWRGRP